MPRSSPSGLPVRAGPQATSGMATAWQARSAEMYAPPRQKFPVEGQTALVVSGLN